MPSRQRECESSCRGPEVALAGTLPHCLARGSGSVKLQQRSCVAECRLLPSAMQLRRWASAAAVTPGKRWRSCQADGSRRQMSSATQLRCCSFPLPLSRTTQSGSVPGKATSGPLQPLPHSLQVCWALYKILLRELQEPVHNRAWATAAFDADLKLPPCTGLKLVPFISPTFFARNAWLPWQDTSRWSVFSTASCRTTLQGLCRRSTYKKWSFSSAPNKGIHIYYLWKNSKVHAAPAG